MKFKSFACPGVSQGISFIGVKKLVVPNQALSLEEILERFTRGESVEVGREGNYDDGDDDLEKMAHADLVDKAEFSERLEGIKKKHQEQEKKKAAKKEQDMINKAAEKLAAEAAKKAAASDSVSTQSKVS